MQHGVVQVFFKLIVEHPVDRRSHVFEGGILLSRIKQFCSRVTVKLRKHRRGQEGPSQDDEPFGDTLDLRLPISNSGRKFQCLSPFWILVREEAF